VLVSDICSRSPITITFHDLHTICIHATLDEIAS
jgi:hypothetical protein